MEILLVLNNAGQHKWKSGTPGDLNSGRCSLVGVDPAKKQQRPTRGEVRLKCGCVDAVVDRCAVSQARMFIGLTNGNVVSAPVVPQVHLDDLF